MKKSYVLMFLFILIVCIYYLSLPFQNQFIILFLYIILFILYIVKPNEAILFITPSLFSTVNINLNLGFTPLRILVVAAILGQLFRGNWSFNNLKAIGVSIILGWTLLLLMLSISSIIYNGQVTQEIFVWVTRCGWMLSYLLAWKNVSNVNYGFWGWVFAGFIETIAAIYIFATTGSVLAITNFLPTQTVDNYVNLLYVLLLVSGFVVVSVFCLWALYSRKEMSLFTTMLFSLLFLFPIFLSGRRQALLGLTLSIILFILIIPMKIKIRTSIILLIGIVVISVSGMYDQFVQGRPSISAELAGKGTGRLQIYSAGIDAFLEKPFLGWGLGNYSDAMEHYGVIDVQKGAGASSHNTFVGVGVESGIFGVLGLLLIFLGTISKGLSLVKLTRKRGVSYWTFTFAIFGYITAGLLVSNVIEGLWYLLPLAMICGLRERLQDEMATNSA